jgi:nucleotide-binding universal stress UspA family protein
MLKVILVAYNGSEPAESAFRFALELAGPFGATVSVVAVAYPPGAPTAVELAGFLGSPTEHLEQALVGLREAAKASGIPVKTKVLVGHPAEQIIREATEQKADVIVMGHRSGRRTERWMARSVSKRVWRRAPCTVTVVR